MSGKPRWRQVFDTVERKIGVPLEDAAASHQFVEVMAIGIKVRRVAGGTVKRVVHGVTGTFLHAVNIPTRDDVRRLSTHITSLAGEIRALEQDQRASAPAAVSPTPRKRAAAKVTRSSGGAGSGASGGKDA